MNEIWTALSQQTDLDAALSECAAKAGATRAGPPPDLAVFFVSHAHAVHFADLARKVRQITTARAVIGCAGETVVGPGKEVEQGPALALWLAWLPGSKITPFRLEVRVVSEGPKERQLVVQGLPEFSVASEEDVRRRQLSVLLLADPYSFPAAEWLEVMNEQYSAVPVFGGMASGGGPGQNRLFLEDRIVESGAVGLLLEGVPVRTVVSQGCRPIGPAMAVTRCHDNVVEELAGRTAVQQLQAVYDQSEGEDRAVLERALRSGGIFLGEVVDERIHKPDRGDFLVRGLLGNDSETGAIAVGSRVRLGRTVRFHVRDSSCADEDLRVLLAQEKPVPPAGALLFSCNGRGTRMFGVPDHDAGCLQDQFPDLPVAGFFAQGEIGPVGGRNFVHGFTASAVLFDRE